MFGIPFLNNYISSIVRVQPVADSVDWLNYYVTSLLLAFFALAISAKQYFGKVLQCWIPQEFKGGWEKYAENYCFINNLYRVPFGEDIPESTDDREDQISYYRWVPIMLALQAFCFYLPNYLWNMLHKQTAVNPRSIVHEVRKCKELCGAEREKEVETIAQFITETVDEFNPRFSREVPRSGWNATMLYLFTKLLYVVNCLGQLMLLDRFLGGDYLSWGFFTLRDVFAGVPWQESALFPRVIMCDFEVRRLGNIHRHTVQCVIMMNMINEKLYLFLYWWFIFVGIATTLNFFYYLIVLCLPYFRSIFIYRNANKSRRVQEFSRGDFARFVHDFLRPDGVLLLQFIRQHVGGRVTYDLVNELLRIFKGRTGSIESTPPTAKSYRGENYAKNISDTYKPTSYGPDGLYPGYTNPQDSYPSGAINDSSDLDFIDNHATLPMSQAGDKRTPVRPIVAPSSIVSTPQRSLNGRTPPSAPFAENIYGTVPKSSTSDV